MHIKQSSDANENVETGLQALRMDMCIHTQMNVYTHAHICMYMVFRTFVGAHQANSDAIAKYIMQSVHIIEKDSDSKWSTGWTGECPQESSLLRCSFWSHCSARQFKTPSTIHEFQRRCLL